MTRPYVPAMGFAAAPSASPGLHRLWPVAVTMVAIALFSVMDALMKRAALAGGVYSALFLRSALGAAGLGPAWLLRAGRWPDSRVMRLHALRGGLQAGMAGAFFWGIVRTPLAEGIAISFIAPLLALFLAAVHLGETIRREAIVASVCCLGGVLVIAAARMGQSGHDSAAAWGMASILLSALLYGWNLVLQRQQAQLARPVEVALFQNLFMALFMAPLLPWLWETPGRDGLIDIAGAAVLASSALMLLAWAYARAEAQVLVPVEYTAFLWSALMGWLWFAERVTGPTLIGLALIIAGVWLGTRGRVAPVTPPA